MLQAVAFDAFGTLCQIIDRRNPYGKLFQQLGLDRASSIRMALTQPLSFADLAALLAAANPERQLTQILPALTAELTAEIQSVQAFPEAVDTLRQVRERGLRTAVVSNLAEPYGFPVKKLFEGMVDSFVFSFAVGAAKPEAEIFKALCQSLNRPAQQVLMVGDTKKSDYEGALAFGMNAVHLDRTGGAHRCPFVSDLQGVLNHL